MQPLKNWTTIKRGYRFKEKTFYSECHLGLDLICPEGTPIFAPFNGRVENHWGYQGGNTIYFRWSDKIMRVMHLSKFVKPGEVKEGDVIGYVGDTGTLSTGPHAHIDISKNKLDIYDINNFINPETFNFNNKDMKKLYLDADTNKQYIEGDDGTKRWIFNQTALEAFHLMGIVDKNNPIKVPKITGIIGKPIAIIDDEIKNI